MGNDAAGDALTLVSTRHYNAHRERVSREEMPLIRERPAAVLLIAAWQVLLGVITIYQARQLDQLIWWLVLVAFGGWHLVTAYGLYNLNEWARQRVVQLAVFDMLGLLQMLFPYPYPYGALLKLGMPLYTMVVLTDTRVRRLFS